MAKKALTARKQPQLLKAIQNKQRDHFESLLQRLVGAEPTQAEIKKWAKENPASYYKSLKTASTLAGYKDGADTTNNYLIQIGAMSDMQLREAINTSEIRKLLEHSSGKEKDITQTETE